jgi:hypothetical protein
MNRTKGAAISMIRTHHTDTPLLNWVNYLSMNHDQQTNIIFTKQSQNLSRRPVAPKPCAKVEVRLMRTKTDAKQTQNIAFPPQKQGSPKKQTHFLDSRVLAFLGPCTVVLRNEPKII